MFQKFKKALSNNRGFTILELIVVIAIMGFLVALVAPRLVNVVSKSKGPVAVTSMQRLSEIVERHIAETGQLPNNLNEIITNTQDYNRLSLKNFSPSYLPSTEPGVVHGPVMWKQGYKVEKGSILNWEFAVKNFLQVNKITQPEADAIKALGITHIIDPKTGSKVPIKRGTNVVMIGAGMNFDGGGRDKKMEAKNGYVSGDFGPKDKGDYYLSDRQSSLHDTTDSRKNNLMIRPDLVYRMVLGVGEESDLAKKGFMGNIGVHPIGLELKEYIKFTDYCIVLPRLQETIDRLYSGDDGINGTATNAAYVSVTADGYDKEGNIIVKGKEIDFTKAQEINDFDIIGIGNETYPVIDVYEWKLVSLKRKNGTTQPVTDQSYQP